MKHKVIKTPSVSSVITTKGNWFEIIDKVDVQGSPQYKVKNSKGNVYYITASEKFMEVN
ncbi:hypothetical protein BwiPL1_20780 [Bacillus wiedmannii]|nr:hypothetical protein BwiPL1_20780 [Bacillus wiedmannii]